MPRNFHKFHLGSDEFCSELSHVRQNVVLTQLTLIGIKSNDTGNNFLLRSYFFLGWMGGGYDIRSDRFTSILSPFYSDQGPIDHKDLYNTLFIRLCSVSVFIMLYHRNSVFNRRLKLNKGTILCCFCNFYPTLGIVRLYCSILQYRVKYRNILRYHFSWRYPPLVLNMACRPTGC